MKIIYSQSNFARKPEFQIVTKIIKEKSKIFVRKETRHQQATNFLNLLFKNYYSIKKNTFNVKIPKIINKKNQLLDFEYLNYPSLEYLIEQSLIISDFQKAESLYLTFLDFINKQPTTGFDSFKDEKFYSIFGQPLKINIKNLPALKFSVLDFNLDNLLFDSQNKRIYLVDWEWVFDFPIPKDYVIFRSLFYLSAHLQLIIKTLCSANFPCIEIINDFFIPKIFWRHSSFSLELIKLFLIMEYNFQNYVLTIPPKYNQDIFLDNLNEKTILNEKNNNLTLQQTSQNTSSKNKEVEILKNEIETLRQQLQKIQSALQKIQSSKTYKIWQGYCKIRDKILRKIGIKRKNESSKN